MILSGEQRDNMRMLKARERPVFLAPTGREFENHRSFCKQRLGREEDTTLRAATQLGNKGIVVEGVSHVGENRGRFGFEETVAVEKNGELGLPLRESP
jgi:hypothetical protein